MRPKKTRAERKAEALRQLREKLAELVLKYPKLCSPESQERADDWIESEDSDDSDEE